MGLGEAVDPDEWLQAVDHAVDVLPYGEALLIAFAIVFLVRLGLIPLIEVIVKHRNK